MVSPRCRPKGDEFNETFSLAFKALLEEALKDLQFCQLCMSNLPTGRSSNFSVSGYDLAFIQGGEEVIVTTKSEPETECHTCHLCHHLWLGKQRHIKISGG